MRAHTRNALLTATALALTAFPAAASFHDMQIEQVVSGICGNPEYQAIQLRMRAAGQNFVAGKPVKAYDAAGGNAVTLLSPPSSVPNGEIGRRILFATARLAADFGVSPDFTLAARIPDSYLKAGKVTFEDPGGFGVLWGIAWGGAGYTGTNTGSTENDLDGIFSPPAFPFRLPFNGSNTLLFGNVAPSAMSTNNAADYAVATPITLTNNAGVAVVISSCLFGDGFVTGDLTSWSATTP